MKNCIVFLALFAAACSGGAPSAEQKRITELEQENAQLQAQLKESRDNVTKLHAAIGRGGGSSAEEGAADEPAGPVAPQPVNPQPETSIGGGSQKIE